jgi:hypothetical protein
MERQLPSVIARWERGGVLDPSAVAERHRATLALLRGIAPAYEGPWRLGAQRWQGESALRGRWK